jgi:hypothetical protein
MIMAKKREYRPNYSAPGINEKEMEAYGVLKRLARINGDYHDWDGPMPPYLEHISLRLTDGKGKWVIRMVPRRDKRSSLHGSITWEVETAYINRRLSSREVDEAEAVAKALRKCGKRLATKSLGSTLCWDIREMPLGKQDVEWLEDFISDSYGANWLYQDREAQLLCRWIADSLISGKTRVTILKEVTVDGSPRKFVQNNLMHYRGQERRTR